MVDVRLYLREKYRPMRPAEWQAAQKPRNLPPRTAPTPQDRDDDPGPEVLQSDEEEVDHPPTKRHKLERLKHPRLKSFYEPEARLRVERFLADDFQTPYATRAQIHEWYEKFSALGRRNFFIVQEHRATAYHHDLRLQLDGQTLSWAVPRGLTNPGGQNRPLAVETQPHSIAWSLWEGPTVGSVDKPTGVLDAGTYTVHETKSAAKKRIGDAKSGLIAEETIDDEPEDEDYQQERLFRDAYHRASFLPTPAAPSAPGLPASDSSHKRGFVVELNGERWRGLKLHFVHDAFDFKVSKSKEAKKGDPGLVRSAQWFFTLSSASPSVPLHATQSSHLAPDRSVLTNRTLDEIRTDSIALLDAVDGRRSKGTGQGKDARTYDPEAVSMLKRMRALEDEGVEEEFTQAEPRYFEREEGSDGR